jgi:hypothetical protein
MRFLRRVVLNDLGLKLLALAISFGLWATYTAEPFSEVGYSVPIAFLNVPPGFTISGDAPSNVHVRLRGRSGLLRRLGSGDLNVSVNLANARAGEMPIMLTPAMVEAPYGTQVVLIAPTQFRLKLITSSAPPETPQ